VSVDVIKWAAAAEMHFLPIDFTSDAFGISKKYSETKIAIAGCEVVRTKITFVVVYSYKSPYNYIYVINK